MARLSIAGAPLLLSACAESEPAFERISLVPGENPFSPSDALWSPQPRRDHPLALALSAGGDKLYVALQGTEDEPGREVAVIDTASEAVLRRIRVGSSPTALALHPGGRFLAVANRFSNFVSVIDTLTDEVALDAPAPFYTVDVAFAPSGERAYLANRWKDSVLRWDIEVGERFRVAWTRDSGVEPDRPAGIPVGQNPRDMALSPDGGRLYVASPTSMHLSIIDTATDSEIRRVNIGSPPGDVLTYNSFVFVVHTGRGTQHRPDEGYDTDGDGLPGDSTANVMFQDVQNEIAVFNADGDLLHEYTSDTICCKDFRDVDPDHPARGAALPAPDTWPASRLLYLPPRESWIVAGALPERLAAAEGRLFVVFSGSNEVQTFAVAADGSLSPEQTQGGLLRTGMNPFDIVVAEGGQRAYVSERLGEGITALDVEAGPGSERRITLASPDAPTFPATDAEVGEAINFVTAPLTVDGDQTCVHCHREGGSVARAVAMPLQKDPAWGARMVMAYRGAYDTRPWFMETAMSETNFFPVINEFARRENFCCEGLDPLIAPAYPSYSECKADPAKAGCDHVLHCADDPPPECAERGYGSPHLSRNEHFLAGARSLFGWDHTPGDVLYQDLPSGVREGFPLDFSGVTRALGLFLLARPRFLPNPNGLFESAATRRGRAIYTSATSGCNTCHPLPLTTVTAEFNPSGVPLRFPAVISPRRRPSGEEVDAITPGFLQTFPDAEQDAGGVRFGAPQLRGIWDRAERFYHDGRARSLREALATPGHPALRPGETGFNETLGMPDTHGSTSRLSPEELEDLISFLLTL